MTTINYGDRNQVVASLNVSGDTIIFGSGQQDMLSLSGDFDTVTFGNGNQDSVRGSLGSGDDDAITVVTLGRGNQDSVDISGGFIKATLGNGNQDSVKVGGAHNAAAVGNGNGDTVTVSGNESDAILGNGNGDTATVSGNSMDVYLGNGRGDTVNLNAVGGVFGGRGDTINLIGDANVVGGYDDTINLAGTLILQSDESMVFIGSDSRVYDDSTGMRLNIGPTAGSDILIGFGNDITSGVIDLIGGAGGFKTTAAVLSALTPDSYGTGTLLSFGPGSSLDIEGVLPSALAAHDFKIG